MKEHTLLWHLLWRSGFGPSLHQIEDYKNLTSMKWWNQIRSKAEKNLLPIQTSSTFVQDNYNRNNNTPELGRQIREQSIKDFREMNQIWINLMADDANPLGEKMALFWHNHFAIRHNNSFLQQDAINTIRKHALGNFRNLLRETSQTGAMLLSLNNVQNRKASPNENFAREILELFSMGIGNYTEKDIKEAARAFTGWNIGRDGRFQFRESFHDNGEKIFFGKTGNLQGDDIIDIILEKRQTAQFIVTKIYTHFVNEKINPSHIKDLTAIFFKDYDILNLMDTIFRSNWFYHESNMGNKIKSPIELIVGLRRFSPRIRLQNRLQQNIQNVLNHRLFYPPSIAGWPIGKDWIDSSTLMIRLQLQDIIAGNTSISIQGKINDDINMGNNNSEDHVQLENVNPDDIDPKWLKWTSHNDIDNITTWIITPMMSHNICTSLKKISMDKNQIIHALFNTPEYQTC